MNDSSQLYFDLTIDSTTADETCKYTFFDLSESQLIYLNNRYLCCVVSVIDTTEHPALQDYTFSTQYRIEFLDFDSTDTLDDYMGDVVYDDFTKHLFKYYFNIRVIKKLDQQNSFFTNNADFFKLLISAKTFFGFQNRATNDVASDWKSFFSNPVILDPLTYSGLYDVTNNARFNMLSLLNSFSANKYTLPYDSTIVKQYITDSTPFIIDLFIANSSDMSNFQGNLATNGMYIFNESGIRDVMVMRLLNAESLNPNTLRLSFTALCSDDTWVAGISSVYHIPSGSWLIQYKYHIYNVIPYVRLDQFNYSNDINNLITIHSFAYTADDPSVLQ